MSGWSKHILPGEGTFVTGLLKQTNTAQVEGSVRVWQLFKGCGAGCGQLLFTICGAVAAWMKAYLYRLHKAIPGQGEPAFMWPYIFSQPQARQVAEAAAQPQTSKHLLVKKAQNEKFARSRLLRLGSIPPASNWV